MGKTFEVGNVIVISHGAWDDYDIDQIVVVVSKFDWQRTMEIWKENTKIDRLTPRNFLKWLFDGNFIRKINYDELYLNNSLQEWSVLGK